MLQRLIQDPSIKYREIWAKSLSQGVSHVNQGGLASVMII